MTVTGSRPSAAVPPTPVAPPADHALLTRFNLPSPGAESLVRAQEGWLRRRVALFESYCLPSVAAQTTTDFSWIVYFDPESPAWLHERIDAWTQDSPMTAILREEVPRETLLADLATVTGGTRPHLITTNLDNDDGLARDFVARVQAAVPAAERTAVYLAEGLITSDDRVYRRVDPRNAFCSVREPWTDAMTCWSEWHNLLERHMPVTEVGGGAAWLQVVHGQNVSNRVRGTLVSPVPYREVFPHLIDDVPPLSRGALRRDRWWDSPRRVGRDAARTTLRTVALRVLGKDGFDRVKASLAHVLKIVRR